MKTFLIRGLPASIQFDSWWMDGPPPPPAKENPTERARPHGIERAILLAALILLADFLLWQVPPGLSLAVFGLCLLLIGLSFSKTNGWGGVILGTVFFLPGIEQIQTLSLGFFIAGLLTGGTWIALGGWPGIRHLWRSTARFILLIPLHSASDLRSALPRLTGTPQNLRRLVLGWALPVGLGLIFLSLMIDANPLVEGWLLRLDTPHLPAPDRLIFWAGMALVIWPFLSLSNLRLTTPARTTPLGPRRLPAILNSASIRRSLILFNLMFALQTAMDATYLWGGATLPDGLSYAQYAHRGAYPLLLTALLAGTFALIARPFTNHDRLMRALLLIWIGQTVLLVISSILRLELYIGVYGLTRLRLAAGIWMVLVAIALTMLIWQVIARHSAAWLLARGALLGLATLYATMFFSFDRAIARYNLTHPVRVDARYICHLGPAALPEIARYNQLFRTNFCAGYPRPDAPSFQDWREWGFRDWRVLRSLAALNAEGTPL
ncbi:hypothetical protein MNBD_ALPHA07-2468 [hydrothermal vent metagenome]|uniref:Uncharacterized protein n=1 Tax=hydrothermal vent metagenome TaxID=652676 RepID=A0A3B0RQX7_9ZZZZ